MTTSAVLLTSSQRQLAERVRKDEWWHHHVLPVGLEPRTTILVPTARRGSTVFAWGSAHLVCRLTNQCPTRVWWETMVVQMLAGVTCRVCWQPSTAPMVATHAMPARRAMGGEWRGAGTATLSLRARVGASSQELPLECDDRWEK